MIVPEQIWLAVEPIDMRLGIDGLSARLQNSLGRAPCDGSAYAFINRARTRLKVLVWDGAGVWLSQRRLHRGSFSWPAADGAVRLVLWDFEAPPARLDVLIVSRFDPDALVVLWLMRTTVVELAAVFVPVFLIFQLALTVVPERLTAPFCTCRSGAVTVKEPMRTRSLSAALVLCPAVLVLLVITHTW